MSKTCRLGARYATCGYHEHCLALQELQVRVAMMQYVSANHVLNSGVCCCGVECDTSARGASPVLQRAHRGLRSTMCESARDSYRQDGSIYPQEYASFVALQSLISAVSVAGQCGCNWCCCSLQCAAVVRFHSAVHAPCVLADAYTNSLLAVARPALDEPVSAHQRYSKHACFSRSTFVSSALAGPHPPL